jgi:hypothetical protein
MKYNGIKFNNGRIIDTILKNELNDIVLMIENEQILSENSETSDIEKMLELLSEYSSELKFKRSLEKLEKALNQKKEDINKNIKEDGLDMKYNVDNLIQCHSIDDKFKKYPEIFLKDFNIFDLSEIVGRDQIFTVVCANIFERLDLFHKVYKKTFINFIEEIKSNYIKSNYYHNVFL